jgi:hypothetical protein
MGPIRFPEASVNNYHSTLRNIPEDQRRGGNLKSCYTLPAKKAAGV